MAKVAFGGEATEGVKVKGGAYMGGVCALCLEVCGKGVDTGEGGGASASFKVDFNLRYINIF
jgi:hypothetical protein